VVPRTGGLYSGIGAPVDVTFDKTQIGQKDGEATSSSVFGLFAFGDCSIQAAALNGNISVIDHVDMEYYNILGIYASYKTIVWGH
jgi:hypothetical protein